MTPVMTVLSFFGATVGLVLVLTASVLVAKRHKNQPRRPTDPPPIVDPPVQGRATPPARGNEKFSDLPILSQLVAVVIVGTIVGGIIALCLGGGYKLANTLIDKVDSTSAEPSWATAREYLLSDTPTVIHWPVGVPPMGARFRSQTYRREDWGRGYYIESQGKRTLFKGPEETNIEFAGGRDLVLTSADGEELLVTFEWIPNK